MDFASWKCPFRMVRKWDLNCEVAYMCLQVILQLRNSFQNFRKLISQLWNFRKLISQLRNFHSAWCGCLLMAITSSFQLWLAHRLKRWISNFLSFETTYSMHKVDSRKCSKYVQQLMSSWILHVRFLSLLSLLAFMIWFWKRTIELQSLASSCKWASNCFSMDSIELSSILDCFGDQKAIKNTKT